MPPAAPAAGRLGAFTIRLEHLSTGIEYALVRADYYD